MKENDIDIEKNTSNNEQEKKQEINQNENVEITEEEIASDELLDEESEKSINIVNNHNEKLIEARKERIYEKSKLELKKNSVRYRIKPALIATMAIVIILVIYFLVEFGPIVGININRNSGNLEMTINETELFSFLGQKIKTQNISRTRKNHTKDSENVGPTKK